MAVLTSIPYELRLQILETISHSGDLYSLLSLASASQSYKEVYEQNRVLLVERTVRVFTGDFFVAARAYANLIHTIPPGSKPEWPNKRDDLVRVVREILNKEHDPSSPDYSGVSLCDIYRVHQLALTFADYLADYYPRRSPASYETPGYNPKREVSKIWHSYCHILQTIEWREPDGNDEDTKNSNLLERICKIMGSGSRRAKAEIRMWVEEQALAHECLILPIGL